jgi:4-hydroxybenzoate polyprenyltransferase
MAAFTTNLPVRTYIVHLLKWLVGAFILRSSACTVNDIFDRDVDARVGKLTASSCWWNVKRLTIYLERTKDRPLPSGRVSVFAATVFLFIQYCAGIMFYYLTTDDLAYVSISCKMSRMTECHSRLWVALFQLLPL